MTNYRLQTYIYHTNRLNLAGRSTAPQPQKESARWIEDYERVAEIAANIPDTQLVYVVDCEANLVAMMRRSHGLDILVNWLVRANHNCCLLDGNGDKLWNVVVQNALEKHGVDSGVVASARYAHATEIPHRIVWLLLAS